MDSKIKAWLFDVQTAISEIEDFVSETRDFTDFSNDLKTR